jgi:hypothetical protein
MTITFETGELVIIVKDCSVYVNKERMRIAKTGDVCIVINETNENKAYGVIELVFPDGTTGITFADYHVVRVTPA